MSKYVDTNALITRFDAYEEKVILSDQFFPDFDLSTKVVSTRIQNLVGKHHRVFFNNYFASVKLMQTHQTKSLSACGTIRTNIKGLPQNIKADK